MRLTVIFVLSATLADGLLAGGDVDRWLVGMPAWQAVGVARWANYSRLARFGQWVRLISDTRDWRHAAFSCRSHDFHAPGEARALRDYSDLCGGGIGCRGTYSDI